MSQRPRLLATAAILLAIAILVYLAGCSPRVSKKTPKPANQSARTKPQPKPKPTTSSVSPLEAALQVDQKALLRFRNAVEPPPPTNVVPLATEYWDEKEKIVWSDHGPAQKVADGAAWYAWTEDGGIVYATRTRILLLDPKSGEQRSIFSAYRIARVFLAPNRRRLAALVGRELFLLRLDGVVEDRIKLRNWLQDAAWSPDSSRIAYASANVVWLAKPGSPASVLTRQDTVRDAISSDSVIRRPTLRIDGISWSASGRNLAYRAYYRNDDLISPNLVVVDTRNAGRKTVMEGYASDDGSYSWGSLEDWMIVAGTEGEPDTFLWLERAWKPEGVQVECYGTSSTFLESDWQPRGGKWAVHLLDFSRSAMSLAEPIDTISIFELDPSRPPPGMAGPKERARLAEWKRKFARGRPTRVASAIPDFDWSPDGSAYVYVERVYTYRQAEDAEKRHNRGQPYVARPQDVIAYLRLQSVNGAQRIVFGNGEHPSAPQFSPDGRRLAYISGQGSLKIRSVGTERRSKQRAKRLLQRGLALQESGRLSAAVTTLRRAIRHDPGLADAHKALSEICLNLARKDINPYRKHNLALAASFETEFGRGRSAD
ncbi:MAG: hypothetical protein Q7T82_12010 [Armatimonadota bacterium]|nr:hypothetical protein [Armatimonadota bacterium]